MPKASRSSRHKQNQNRPSNQEQQTPTASADAAIRPRRRIQEMSSTTRIISLVVGDILCFLIFASLGTNVHDKGANVFYIVWVAIPFIAAWFLVSPFVGAFRADIATSPKKMLIRVVLSWLATWPVAMLFRWLLIDRVASPQPSPGAFLSFAIVTLIANLILLVLWRWPFALNNNLRKRGV